MDHFEMVEKLREKANVSYEEAKAALEAADWNLLDALVLLENQGKVVSGTTDYSTKSESWHDEHTRDHHRRHAENAGRIGRQVASGINRMGRYFVVFTRKGETMFELPLLVLLLMLVFGFWITVPLLIVGLFFGFKYTLKGAEGVEAVNRVMDKASEVAGNIVTEVRKETGGNNNQ
jgi:hypothetical protein